MAAGGYFRSPKITFDHISRHLTSTRNFDFFSINWLAAAILDDRKSFSIAFLAISDQYATLTFFDFVDKWLPAAILVTKNHFRSHFLPFQINTQVLFFTKWFPAAILDDRKSLLIAFLAHFRSIRNFFCLYKMAASGHFG